MLEYSSKSTEGIGHQPTVRFPSEAPAQICVRSGHSRLTWEFTRNSEGGGSSISYTNYQKYMQYSPNDVFPVFQHSREIPSKFLVYSSMPTSEPNKPVSGPQPCPSARPIPAETPSRAPAPYQLP
jgi:hypothetical protein